MIWAAVAIVWMGGFLLGFTTGTLRCNNKYQKLIKDYYARTFVARNKKGLED